MSNIRFVNKGKTGEIWLYDLVGEGFFGGISAQSFVSQVQKLGKVDLINLHINSRGGSFFDGVAMYNTLNQHPARIEVDVDGEAASIASLIAMAGDEIRMAENAFMMIHNPMGTVMQEDAQAMRKTADLLDQVKESMVATYSKRTKLKAEEIVKMMNAETWMNADLAQEKGFADLVSKSQRVAACAGVELLNFKHLPPQLNTQQQRSAGHSMAQVKLVAMDTRIEGLPR